MQETREHAITPRPWISGWAWPMSGIAGIIFIENTGASLEALKLGYEAHNKRGDPLRVHLHFMQSDATRISLWLRRV